jgi:hypothetical protein
LTGLSASWKVQSGCKLAACVLPNNLTMQRWLRATVAFLGLSAALFVFGSSLREIPFWAHRIDGRIVEVDPHVGRCFVTDAPDKRVLLQSRACREPVGTRLTKPAWSLDVRTENGRVSERPSWTIAVAVIAVSIPTWYFLSVLLLEPLRARRLRKQALR